MASKSSVSKKYLKKNYMATKNKYSKRLKNKHQGGINNAKGNLYEALYAVYQMALLIDSHRDNLSTTFLSSQVDGAFVDDFLVNENEVLAYHQIKNVKALNWGKELLQDFNRQLHLSNSRNEDFTLKLVYSNRTCNLLPIPDSIISHTSIEYFPYASTINQLLLSYSPFRDAISNISFSQSDDALLMLATLMYGVWAAAECHNQTSLASLSEQIKKLSKGNIDMNIYSYMPISKECANIFENIGVTYYVYDTNLYWSYGYFEGKCKWDNSLEKSLINSSPSNWEELINILSQEGIA